MVRHKNLAFAFSLFSVVALTGCLSSPTTFVPASEPVDAKGYTVLGESVSGTDSQFMILFVTFGSRGSSQRHALEAALKQSDESDALVGMAVDHEIFGIPPVFFVSRTRVTGTPVKVLRNQ